MKSIYRKYRKIVFVLSVLLFGKTGTVHAQGADSLSLLRDFISISTGYKQLPLYLEMEMRNSSNLVIEQRDTAVVKGEFFLRDDISYVHFGEFEQIVSDSLALLVSDNLQQMILYTNIAPVTGQMKKMLSPGVPDSSLKKLAERYKAYAVQSQGTTTGLHLDSRTILRGTQISKETIELSYDPSRRTPLKVVTLQRSLVRLDSVQVLQVQTDPALSLKLVSLNGNPYLIREQSVAYIFHRIEKGTTAKIPVLISDRITRNREGEYEPVKKYEAYRLTQND